MQEQDTAPTDDPDTTPAPEVAAAEQRAVEFEDRYKRAVADLDNMRKRYARELDRERSEERSRALAALLPIVDNLELALTHAEADPQTIVDGVRSVRDQAVEVLAKLGYPRQDDVGVPFDPNRHEVVRIVEDVQAPAGTVVEVLRPGYGTGQRQLRPAAVAVTKTPE